MATVLNTLYPPVVDSYMPAFDRSTSAVVSYSISPYNSSDVSSIKKVHVSVVDMKTNRNVLTNKLLFKENTLNSDTNQYEITIDPDELISGSFNANQFYKVQLRFDTYGITKVSEITDSTLPYFSEWSSVCLIRPIDTPAIYHSGNIPGLKGLSSEDIAVPTFPNGDLPINGVLKFGGNDNSLEYLQSYIVKIYDADDNVLWTSDTIYPSNNNEINTVCDISNETVYQNGESYKVGLKYTTQNGFSAEEKYDFQVQKTKDCPYRLIGKLDDDYGFMSLTIEPVKENTYPLGYIIVKRADSSDDFSTWTTIRKEELPEENADEYVENIKIFDNTIESLHAYKYSIQFITSLGIYTKSILLKENNDYETKDNKTWVVVPTFFGAFFSRGNKQLKLSFDFSIGSITPVVNRTKVDTLGSRYPKFTENARMKYYQYSISGTISSQDDGGFECLTFGEDPQDWFMCGDMSTGVVDSRRNIMNKELYDAVYDDKGKEAAYKPVSGEDTYAPHYYNDVFNFNNPLWERMFKEQVVDWLNDGEPKLFRTESEGNKAVMITDVSLTPKAQLDRRLWDFSATMYEVADASSLESLSDAGIWEIIDTDTGFYSTTFGGEVETIRQIISIDLESGKSLKEVINGRITDMYHSAADGDDESYTYTPITTHIQGLKVQLSGPTTTAGNYQITVNDEKFSVNPTGIFQVPSYITVLDFYCDDVNVTATCDCCVEIQLQTTITGVTNYYTYKYIQGQIAGYFEKGEDIFAAIVKKHGYTQYKIDNSQSTKIDYIETIDYINGLTIFTDPMVQFKITYAVDAKPEESLLIPFTGAISLKDDFNVCGISIANRMAYTSNNDVLRPFEANKNDLDDSGWIIKDYEGSWVEIDYYARIIRRVYK